MFHLCWSGGRYAEKMGRRQFCWMTAQARMAPVLAARGGLRRRWAMTLQPGNLLQRAKGEAFVRLGTQGLIDLRQQGSAKAIMPHVGGRPEVVFLNTSGGLTDGDRLTYHLQLGDGVQAIATTQTAERAYLATAGAAKVAVSLQVGAGGWLDWLPQETILFDGARLARTTRVELAAAAGCLLLEAVVLGRAAMGETVGQVQFRDRREVWQGGVLRLLEPLHMTDDALQTGFAGLNGARAFASVAMIGQGAEDALGPVRAVLGEGAAASAFDGKLMVRMMAGDGWPLRQQIAVVLQVLTRRALPRVWQM
jgi:urease accessory protein